MLMLKSMPVNSHTVSESDIDVSMSGVASVLWRGGPPAGSLCMVSLFLQPLDEQSIAIEQREKLSRSDSGSIAVEFTGLDPDSYYHLRQLILNNAGDPEKAESEFDAHWGIRRPKRFRKRTALIKAFSARITSESGIFIHERRSHMVQKASAALTDMMNKAIAQGDPGERPIHVAACDGQGPRVG